MIKKFLLGTVALGAMTTMALAADLPSRRAPPVYVPPIPVFSWTGFYVGGDIGYQFGKDTRANAPANVVSNPHGVAGGGHIGYNFAGLPGFGGGLGLGGLVFGVEGDIVGSDYRQQNNALQIRQDIQGSARGRVGFAVDRALFFATGGAAFANFEENYITTGAQQRFTHTRVGWTVGGGVEYAITTQWSLRAEYRYEDFGTLQDFGVRGGGPTIAGNNSRKETIQRATVGFSYKFDTPVAPVVARY